MAKRRRIYKSSKTGRIVSKKYADSHKSTTYGTNVSVGRKRSR